MIANDSRIKCEICPIGCELRKDQIGACGVRKSNGSSIFLEAYNKITSVSIEPIEKKPIYHWAANQKTLSIGGYGCNMSCSFCFNWKISQFNLYNDAKNLSTHDIVRMAQENKCESVCFTFNEPIIYYEYFLDLADECKHNNIDIIAKTNGFATEKVWTNFVRSCSAINIDWKGGPKKYLETTGVVFENVFERIHQAYPLAHVELSVPVYNDSCLEDYNDLISLGNDYPDLPIHLLRILPAYKDSIVQITSFSLLKKLKNLLTNKYNYVYIHNTYDESDSRDTFCSVCKDKIVERESLSSSVLRESCCSKRVFKKYVR